jgi:predicted transposase/invertase (TIGR01784 family)
LIKKDKTTPQEYARMKDEYANEQYLKEKNAKARAQGREEGIEEAKRKMAKNLLDVLDLETIALKSGLTLEEVRQLKDAEKKG